MLRLVEKRPIVGRVLSVESDQVLGREGCDVVLPDPEVSRRHAAVRRLDSGLGVEDLGSLNGTFVNGERIAGLRQLQPGDTLQLGNTLLRVESVG